ncbi:NAD(+) diphosphatase [Pendulispora albinea]|uniref:NAD-capped RNA hydrolase NudC n=1 Tax=Pendulispora albinea TaxID=2741071 RepID=A0ABZ2M1K8_9BACT
MSNVRPTRPADVSQRTWLLVHPKGIVVRREGDAVAFPTDEDVAQLAIDVSGAHHLGRLEGSEVDAFAVACNADVELPAPLVVSNLRELFIPLGDAQFWLAGRAAQVVDWASTHRFCGRCATATERVENERCLRCPACGLLSYPRISPAIIVLVRRDDRVLLARNARSTYGFYSVLAGFSEIGESLEETIVREVREEVGVEVTNARYFGSQPWPFPHSLMIGFTADWRSGEIRVDGEEIAHADWFPADALPPIPPRLSIARSLIDAWVADIHATRAAAEVGK